MATKPSTAKWPLIVAQFCCLAGLLAAYSRNFTRLKTAADLGVPECVGDADCVYGGVCARELRGGASRCLCSSSCPLSVPVQCAEDNDYSCMTMGYAYTSRYDMRSPMCYYKRCICPPAFDANVLQPPIAGFTATLPMKCDRRELRAMIVASPSDVVYKGTEANIYCCVNVDPRTFISQNGVYFVQNGTRKIEPTTTPYENFSRDIDTLFTVPTCWILHVGGAQPSDGGAYVCVVQPTGARYPTVNATLEFVVTNSPPTDQSDALTDDKPPDFVHNLQIHENTTSAVVTWTSAEPVGHHTPPGVDFTLFDRYVKAKEVWRRTDAKSPLLIDGLQPGTPYTLFMTLHTTGGEAPAAGGRAGQIPFSRQFSTKPTSPDPPPLDAIRLVSAENGGGQLCEIEWRPAHREREFITRYYVKISGRLRYVSPELQIAESTGDDGAEDGGDGSAAVGLDEDYPPGAESCVNFYRDADRYINATTFHKRFLACKYGPLKPNRNYSASVWVENEAGRSRPAVFEGQCVTDYAAPDRLAAPQPLAPANMSSFQLRFQQAPDEHNGPIVCYYLAIVPLPSNVSVANLPPPALIVMDSFDKALQNNLQPFAVDSRRFFAYVAESYMQHPTAGATTTVGDGNVSGGAERCSVLYLARHRPMDPALTPNLKYTGFLVARVDRDRSLQTAGTVVGAPGPATAETRGPPMSGRVRGGRPPRDASPNFIPLSASFLAGAEGPASLRRRQLANFDPDYGFSEYFEPVLLEENPGGGLLAVPLLLVLALSVLVGALAAGAIFVCRRRQKQKRRIPAVGANALRGSGSAAAAAASWRTRLARLYARVRWTARSKHDLLRATPPQPIRADELAGEYVMRHRDSNFHFTQEFEMLPRGKDLDHTTSDRNARKNRYNDIKACDATRVRLRRRSGDISSDYINANFIKGYKSRKVFIAAQGPLDNTVDDFWRMIWEQGVRIVVMVTNLRERCREQCVKYWPDDERPTLAAAGGRLHVRSLKSTYFAEYALREFEVIEMQQAPVAGAGGSRAPSALSGGGGAAADGPPSRPASAAVFRDSNRPSSRNSGYDGDLPRERRRVFQYHFTCWHDYKAPECVALLRLVGKLRKLDDYNSTPVVVHCSAGVGRTGTMIAIDYLMDQCQEEGRVDVFRCVAEMRQQRNLMVQSVEQYAFIYKALAEHQLFGDTDLSESEFRGYYARLRLPLASGGPAGGRERHHSVGSTRSSSARSNSIIGAQSLCASSSTASRGAAGSGGARAALLSNTAALSAGIKAKLRLVRGATAAAVVNCNGATQSATAPATTGTTVATPPAGITLLDAEFNNLSVSLDKPRATDWAQKPENVARNRDSAAVPFDVNRVVLSHFTGYDSTYINASSIKGYFYAYIMAQDPLDAETAFDFWRMVHDQNASTLVQLMPDEAFGLAERFWPAGSGQTTLTLGRRGELIVRLLGVSAVGGVAGVGESAYLVRRLHYRFTTEKDSPGRELVQYVYRQWRTVPSVSGAGSPDSSSPSNSAVPRNVAGFLALTGAVLDQHGQADQPDVGPILVHCRDGSSRSGLFCAVALLLERLNSEHMIDVFRTAKGLKLQRARLFNNTEEYGFLFDCMMEYVGAPSQRAYRFAN